ncbi:hypothetical protein BC829DRAFT_270466 [Chytridium lagenaria]|nr:hypothetical protein BC829DRAFT_270466 [Chytridium lagenaria]
MTGGSSSASSRDARRWEDKEIEVMRRAMETLREELVEIGKARRKLASDEQLQSAISVLENRLNVFEDDLNTTRRKIDTVDKETAHLQGELEKSEPDVQKLSESFDEQEAELKEIEARVFKVEDAAFAKFCKKIGVANVREYEEGQGALEKEVEQRRMEFGTNKAKFENQLDFERKQAAELQERVEKLRAAIEADERDLSGLLASRSDHDEESKRLEEELQRLSDVKEGMEAKAEKARHVIEEAKKVLAKANKEVEAFRKGIAAKVDIFSI